MTTMATLSGMAVVTYNVEDIKINYLRDLNGYREKMELKDDLFLIPVEDGNLVYYPLHRGLFWASEDASNVVRRYLADGCVDCNDDNLSENINKLSKAKVFFPSSNDTPATNRLVIILSQSCNLACTYC